MNRFQEIDEGLRQETREARKLIAQNLKNMGSPQLRTVFDYLLSSEGKFLRAKVTILSGQAGNGDTDQLVKAAAAFEMLHMATLVHDDIIDDSKYRRGQESLQSRFGKDVAVYAGDYILARAFRLMAESQMEFLAPLSRGVEKICAGEILQNMNRYNSELDDRSCLKIISGKTAALFYMCAWAGARIAHMEKKEQSALAGAARHMGMAFQLMDDCRDYDGDRAALRKEPENDIKNGIYTMPLVLALKNGEIPEFQIWKEQGATEKIAAAVKASKGIKQTRLLAEQYLKKAEKELGYLNQNEAVRQLKLLYQGVVEG